MEQPLPPAQALPLVITFTGEEAATVRQLAEEYGGCARQLIRALLGSAAAERGLPWPAAGGAGTGQANGGRDR